MPKSTQANVHVVAPGDRLSRIAFLHGYASTAAIWDAPENRELRARRPNPEVLMPGDRVFLPAKTDEAHDALGEGETKLAHEPIASEVCVRLLFDGAPIVTRGKVRVRIETEPYSPGRPYEGEVTLADGVARFHVDPRVTEVSLLSDDPPFALRLLVGHLQPLDEPAGVGLEQRLSNLGFHCPTALPPGPSASAKEAQAARQAHARARFRDAHHEEPTAAVLRKRGQP